VRRGVVDVVNACLETGVAGLGVRADVPVGAHAVGGMDVDLGSRSQIGVRGLGGRWVVGNGLGGGRCGRR
jgi:hypothetical protein